MPHCSKQNSLQASSTNKTAELSARLAAASTVYASVWKLKRAVISPTAQVFNPALQRTSTQLTQVARPEPLLNISMINLVPVQAAFFVFSLHQCCRAAIIANSIVLDIVLKAVCTTRVLVAPNDDDAWKRTTERTLSAP